LIDVLIRLLKKECDTSLECIKNNDEPVNTGKRIRELWKDVTLCVVNFIGVNCGKAVALE
jgi:hypothetical protein